MEPTTCTYGPLATTGEPCGLPAVATFGEGFAECELHHIAIEVPAAVVTKPVTFKGCYYGPCMDYYGRAHYPAGGEVHVAAHKLF